MSDNRVWARMVFDGENGVLGGEEGVCESVYACVRVCDHNHLWQCQQAQDM